MAKFQVIIPSVLLVIFVPIVSGTIYDNLVYYLSKVYGTIIKYPNPAEDGSFIDIDLSEPEHQSRSGIVSKPSYLLYTR